MRSAILLALAALGCAPGVLGAPRTLDAAAPTPEPPADAGTPPPIDAPATPDAAPACAAPRPRVYHGTLEPTLLPLARGQLLAIGRFALPSSSCSGTIVAPRWVLTASHCTVLGSPSTSTFRVGADPGAPDVVLRIRRFVDHPRVDQALLELEEDATARVPGLEPIPIPAADLDDAWIGRTVEGAGYGRTERGTSGTRHFTAEPLVALGATYLTVDGEGARGLCFGDSGGPVLGLADDGSIRVLGDLHGGDTSCLGRDHYTRTDLTRAWLEGYLGPTPTDPPAPPDGSACDGDTLTYVGEDGARVEVDCAPCGLACAVTSGRADCAPDPCEGLDYLGRCDGETARWCDDGVLRTRDCAADGLRCGWVSDTTGFYCE